MDVEAALTAVRSSCTILEGMHAGERLRVAARGAADDAVHVLVAGTADGDPITAIAAVHALGAQGSESAAHPLVALLDDDRAYVAEHAVDALRAVVPRPDGMPRLARYVRDGGFTGMLAQRTLETWAAAAAEAVREVLADALASERDPGARARLVETAGLLPGLADAPAAGPAPRRHQGLTVAQLFLHGEVDGDLRHSGQGDTGGVATLLVQLGDALLRQRSGVTRVITLTGSRDEVGAVAMAEGGAVPAPSRALFGGGHHYAHVPLLRPSTGAATAWPLRVEARRGIRTILRAAGPVDVIHLRMADVGSMAAAEVAAELGIPVVLTLAPDPQALIAAREADGTLTRAGFGAADRVEHLWFRDHLLRRLAEQAEHLVLLPRPEVERDISRLVGIDLSERPERVDVVGEGVDLVALERVAKEVAGESPPSRATTDALEELDGLLSSLPPDRRSLPLAVSVGRLAPVKGMATLASTWLADENLRRRCNLLVIGGDLDHPTPEEAGELSRISAAVSCDQAAGAGLLLAGHRPNTTTTAWLAAARRGRPGMSAPDGVYVCASLKEEFGIAILEAMAMGLVVVAPNGGGPATYVEDGVTGVLTDTSNHQSLADGITEALDLCASPGDPLRTRRSRALVRERFSIDAVAASLGLVYSRVASRLDEQPRSMAAAP